MPIELETFHHVYNRGTDKRVVFNNIKDYKRFVLYLNVVNDVEILSPAHNGMSEEESYSSHPSERLVNLVAFCLMPNHFHLLLQERTSGGISKFMQRLGTAYTMYFNEKNERSGALFQGRFKNRLIDSEAYLLKIIDYIHLNPMGSNSIANSQDNLDNHEWSSYHHYCGKNKFSYMLQPEALDRFTKISVGDEYKQWVSSQNDFSEVEHLLIDPKG